MLKMALWDRVLVMLDVALFAGFLLLLWFVGGCEARAAAPQ